jgi:OOP family OmpA-OmpF porin
MRCFIAPIFITPLLLGGLPAFAQGNPSADQIINQLRPGPNLVPGQTRGIRLGTPTNNSAAPAPAASAPHQQSVAASRPAATSSPPAAESSPSVSLTVVFATGSAELTPQAIQTLDELGRALSSQDLASYRFRIEGHTDTVGSRDYNQALSERRADAVVQYVAKKYSIDPSRLQAVGMGEEGLAVPTPPQTPEPRNRRVQVINLGA